METYFADNYKGRSGTNAEMWLNTITTWGWLVPNKPGNAFDLSSNRLEILMTDQLIFEKFFD